MMDSLSCSPTGSSTATIGPRRRSVAGARWADQIGRVEVSLKTNHDHQDSHRHVGAPACEVNGSVPTIDHSGSGPAAPPCATGSGSPPPSVAARLHQ